MLEGMSMCHCPCSGNDVCKIRRSFWEKDKKRAPSHSKSALVGRKAEDGLLLRDAQRGHAVVRAENHVVHACSEAAEIESGAVFARGQAAELTKFHALSQCIVTSTVTSLDCPRVYTTCASPAVGLGNTSRDSSKPSSSMSVEVEFTSKERMSSLYATSESLAAPSKLTMVETCSVPL